jgi:hypothetical protein
VTAVSGQTASGLALDDSNVYWTAFEGASGTCTVAKALK